MISPNPPSRFLTPEFRSRRPHPQPSRNPVRRRNLPVLIVSADDLNWPYIVENKVSPWALIATNPSPVFSLSNSSCGRAFGAKRRAIIGNHDDIFLVRIDADSWPKHFRAREFAPLSVAPQLRHFSGAISCCGCFSGGAASGQSFRFRWVGSHA